MRKGPGKVWRVLGGTLAMLAFVAVVLAILVRYAGGWGVPYFSFTSAHGSSCRNDIVGYTCTPLTLADVEFFGDIDLPNRSTVLTSRYHTTHDYQLAAQVEVPAADAPAALRQLRSSFGRCQKGANPPVSTKGLTSVCVMVNPEGVEADGELSSRLYSVGTGLRKDGTRFVAMDIRSR